MSSPTPIVPAALKPGATIAFISPSTRLNPLLPAHHARAAKHFETLGYNVKVIFGDYDADTLQRVQEVHDAFLDPSVSCIISTVGGSTINELLPHLDYSIIRQNPKIFMGYSDNTLLQYALLTQTGLQTFYGPCALTEFSEYPTPDKFTVDHFARVLTEAKPAGLVPRSQSFAPDLLPFFVHGDETTIIRSMEPSPKWTWLRPGKCAGRLIGGCITTLLKLTGTQFWPSHKGCILFLETPPADDLSKPLPLTRARECLAALVSTGIFDEISGLVFGRCYQYDTKMRNELGEILLEVLGAWKWPILMEVDIGHTSPMLTLPFNVMAELDSEKDEFSILEAAVA